MADPVKSFAGRLGAWSIHARGRTNTQPGREKFLSKFEREVDPLGELDPEERARRAAFARSAYFARLARRSAQVRRARKGGSS